MASPGGSFACSCPDAGALALADFPEFAPHRHLVEAGEREREEQRNTVLKVAQGLHEGLALIIDFDGGRLLQDPKKDVEGKRGSGRVNLGGRLFINNKKIKKE